MPMPNLAARATVQADRHALIRAEVGRRVRQQRQLLGIPRRVLADVLGVTVSQVAKYESGIDMMAASTLYRIATLLQTNVATLLEGADSDGGPPEGGVSEHEGPSAADHNVFALIANFRRIEDRELRRLLLRAVERIAALPAQSQGGAPQSLAADGLAAVLAEAL